MFCFPFQIYHYVWANHRIVENKTMELISRCDFEIQTRPRNLLSSTDNSRQPSKMYDSHASHIVLGRVFIITHTLGVLYAISLWKGSICLSTISTTAGYTTQYTQPHTCIAVAPRWNFLFGDFYILSFIASFVNIIKMETKWHIVSLKI